MLLRADFVGAAIAGVGATIAIVGAAIAACGATGALVGAAIAAVGAAGALVGAAIASAGAAGALVGAAIAAAGASSSLDPVPPQKSPSDTIRTADTATTATTATEVAAASTGLQPRRLQSSHDRRGSSRRDFNRCHVSSGARRCSDSAAKWSRSIRSIPRSNESSRAITNPPSPAAPAPPAGARAPGEAATWRSLP